MTTRTAHVITCLVSTLAPILSLSSGCGARPPAIEVVGGIDKIRHLGEGVPGEIVRGKVTIRNAGREPLVIARVTGSCSCTDLHPVAPFTIASKQSLDLDVGIRLSTEGERRLATIEIESNDPSHLYTDFQVSAYAPAFALARPTSVAFGSVRPGDSRTIELEVRTASGEPWPRNEQLEVSTGDPSFRVTAGEAPGAFNVVFTAGTSLAAAETSVHIKHVRLGRILTVPCLARTRQPMIVVPRSIRIARDARVPRRVIVKRDDGLPLGAFRGAEGIDHVVATECSRHNSFAQLDISTLEPLDGIVEDQPQPVRLWFEGCEDPATVLVVLEQ